MDDVRDFLKQVLLEVFQLILVLQIQGKSAFCKLERVADRGKCIEANWRADH